MPSSDLFSEGTDDRPPHVLGIRVLVVGIVLLLVGGGFLYFKGQSLRIPTDPHSLCPTKRSPSAVVAILLDPSDRLGEPQKIQLRGILQRVSNEVPRFGLVEVYRLGTLASMVPDPIVHLCNPGSGQDVSKIYSNPDLAIKRWQRFADSVTATIDREISGDQQSTSPIFEAVQAIGVRAFSQPMFDNRPKRLVIVSDLLQNVSGGLDMYKPIPPFGVFKSTPYYARVRTDLDSVHIFILYINRPAVPTQGYGHVSFWRDYFADQGATVDSVKQVFGAK